MSKEKTKRFSLQGFDNQHYQRTEEYVRVVDRLFDMATAEIAQLSALGKYDSKKPFSFADYPRTHVQVQAVVNGLASNMKAVIETASHKQWLYACEKNDAFIQSIFETSKLSKADLVKMQDRNLDALQTFQKRKVDGMDLSKRVWNYTEQYKKQIELGLDVGLGDGRSAQQLSRDLRQNLKDPDRLFRRVRDKRGNLHLSKNAEAFNPGQGVYRSSAKNAERLTRSEINMAYRESDYLRWQQLDFVVGIDIQVSERHIVFIEEVWSKQNPGKIEICDKLCGKYPKWFKFKGWHPQCMCFATPIIEDFFGKERSNDRVNRLKAALKGKEHEKYVSKATITDVPDGFKEWVATHSEKQTKWKSSPYFVRDNFKDGLMTKGLKVLSSPQSKSVPKIEPETKPIEAPKISLVPKELQNGSVYLHNEDYDFDENFFKLLNPDKPIKLEIVTKEDGAYYSAGKVHLCDAKRNKDSAWHKKAVVYHEYGHAIDWQRNLRKSNELAEMRAKQIKDLKKRADYEVWTRTIDYDKMVYKYSKVTSKMSKVAFIDNKLKDIMKRLWKMDASVFTKRGITKMDAIEQFGSVRDTIKSLVVSYGDGHSTAYFRNPFFKEAEYLAHAFENTFIGNRVFKKYLPDIYDDMVEYIKSLDKY